MLQLVAIPFYMLHNILHNSSFSCSVSFSTLHKRQKYVNEDLHFELLISSSSYDVLCDQRT